MRNRKETACGKNRKLRFGSRRPTGKVLRAYEKWDPELLQEDGKWCLYFGEDQLRHLCVEFLLYHEVGHHIDWYQRHWSKANSRQCEEFADQYAMERTKTATYVCNQLNKLSS